MAMHQDFTKQIEAQLEIWQAQIKQHQDELAKAGAQARAGYETALSSLRENADQASKLLQRAKDAGEACLEGQPGCLGQSARGAAKGLGRRPRSLRRMTRAGSNAALPLGVSALTMQPFSRAPRTANDVQRDAGRSVAVGNGHG